jgi:hypothetical protein
VIEHFNVVFLDEVEMFLASLDIKVRVPYKKGVFKFLEKNVIMTKNTHMEI